MTKQAIIAFMCLAMANVCSAYELPNCVDRVHKFKKPMLPVKKDVLRDKSGCLFTINWSIEEGNKRPDLIDIRNREECQEIGKRLEKAWKKSILFKGKSVAHCQTKIRIKCPSRKKPCRFIFQLPEDDPVFNGSQIKRS